MWQVFRKVSLLLQRRASLDEVKDALGLEEEEESPVSEKDSWTN